MKKLIATFFVAAVVAVNVLAQSPPTLTIVTETPGLPSDLFYGSIKVKPLRLRPGTNTPITIADYDFFIQQQYIDFLRRFPEPNCPAHNCGIEFYLPILNGCNPADINCVKYTRGAVSANFFRSPEFQRKGNYVLFLYVTALGQRAITAAELNDASKIDRPHYAEFMADLGSISTPNDDPALTETKKNALADAWVIRPEFVTKYPGSGNANPAYVQALLNTAGVTNSQQAQLGDGTKTRAQVLRIIAESPEVSAKFYKPAFVTMEYFGYLRRDPEDCHNPSNWTGGDPNQCGYIFHNNRFLSPGDPDFIENTIVRGFIEAPEYINRF